MPAFLIRQKSEIFATFSPGEGLRGNFGLRQSVKVGDTNLATYRYTNDRNNYLEALDYGNDGIVNYTYDDKGRLLTQTYEDGDTLTHTYDNSGNLATVTDSATGRKTTYYYDLTDRLMKTVETGTDYLHSVEFTYDAKNNLTQQVENINGVIRTVSYSYDKDNRVTDVSDGTVSVHYTYDSYGRVSKKETKNNGTDIKTEEYTFQDLRPNDIYTSDVISTYKITIRDEQVVTYSYTYDNNGNILTVSDGTNTISYTYDSANQLVQEQNSQTGTHTWSYDNAGNITAADNVVYTYENEEWKDQLTNYNGREIEYDLIGNPTNDGIWSYTWEHGRQLASMSDGNTTWSYTYDADGLRTGRTNGTDTYSYVYNGGSLSKLTKGSDTLYFTYDANGTPLTVNYNGTVYYYVTNLQGDVVKILNSSGTAVAAYTYDAWGKPLSTTGTMADTLGQINPLRYRGYIYDTETGLYYLQSRYYNPEMGRFINADVFASTGQGLLGNNMFAYCLNNPICMADPTGEAAITISITTLILVGSALVGLGSAAYTAYKEYQAGLGAVRIIGDSICAGVSAFGIVYTLGFTLNQCYQNYCYLNALTPVTEINIGNNISAQLQNCANTANSSVSGTGPVAGTKKHTVFASEVNALKNRSLRTEVSYKNGLIVPYGTKGSTRFDVVMYNAKNQPIMAWDFKTGAATLSFERMEEMRLKSGLNISIGLIK